MMKRQERWRQFQYKGNLCPTSRGELGAEFFKGPPPFSPPPPPPLPAAAPPWPGWCCFLCSDWLWLEGWWWAAADWPWADWPWVDWALWVEGAAPLVFLLWSTFRWRKRWMETTKRDHFDCDTKVMFWCQLSPDSATSRFLTLQFKNMMPPVLPNLKSNC